MNTVARVEENARSFHRRQDGTGSQPTFDHRVPRVSRESDDAFQVIMQSAQNALSERDRAWGHVSTILGTPGRRNEDNFPSALVSRKEDVSLICRIFLGARYNDHLAQSLPLVFSGRKKGTHPERYYPVDCYTERDFMNQEALDWVLSIAIDSGEMNLVIEVLRAGADINYDDARIVPHMLWATKKGNDEMIALLISLGADISTRSEFENYMSPLEMAILLGNAYLIEHLLFHQANDRCKLFPGDALSVTPLELAVETFGRLYFFVDYENTYRESIPVRPSVVKLLAKHSKDVNRTLSGTPILIQVLLKWESLKKLGILQDENVWCECLRHLLESGADVKMLLCGKTSCLDIAHRLQSHQAKQLLYRWGAKYE